MFRFLKQWFRKKPASRPAVVDVKTAPLSEEQLAAVTQPGTVRPVQLLAGSAQSVGMQREHNEDTLFAMTSLLADGGDDLPFGIFMIADGMGGHQHGEVASAAAARAMASYLISHVYKLFLDMQPQGQTESIQEMMEIGVAEAQRVVTHKAPGGGTTLTTALVIGDQLTIAHVGDSRAYLIHPDGRMQALTQDHSLVQRLLELGQISEEEAHVHPQRNVLYRAVGQSDPLHPDVKSFPLPRPCHLLLCSDGLWGVIEEKEIYRIIRGNPHPVEACQKLVDAANENGGPDNISVILVYYPV